MPEGPSIVIVKENLKFLKGARILEASGDAKIDMDQFANQTIVDFKSWGKHFLICLPRMTVRIHFLMFGSYTINEQKTRMPKLHFRFNDDDVYFYTCAVKLINDPIDTVYDWSADVMNDAWNPALAKKKLKKIPDTLICDALMDQEIFSGVGNIIKNEILFLACIHPQSVAGNIPARKLTSLISLARSYSFDFLHWKKANELKKHWLVYSKKTCPRCKIPLVKAYPGKTKRRCFFCNNCQERW